MGTQTKRYKRGERLLRISGNISSAYLRKQDERAALAANEIAEISLILRGVVNPPTGFNLHAPLHIGGCD